MSGFWCRLVAMLILDFGSPDASAKAAAGESSGCLDPRLSFRFSAFTNGRLLPGPTTHAREEPDCFLQQRDSPAFHWVLSLQHRCAGETYPPYKPLVPKKKEQNNNRYRNAEKPKQYSSAHDRLHYLSSDNHANYKRFRGSKLDYLVRYGIIVAGVATACRAFVRIKWCHLT